LFCHVTFVADNNAHHVGTVAQLNFVWSVDILHAAKKKNLLSIGCGKNSWLRSSSCFHHFKIKLFRYYITDFCQTHSTIGLPKIQR